MDTFQHYTPTEILFGRDVEDRTGELAAKYGSRVLLVYGQGSVVRSGLLDRVKTSLDRAGLAHRDFPGAQPNPTLAHAEAGVREALDFGADVILGVGGGSAIDTAKAIAHGTANPETALWDIWTRKVPLTKSLPVGAVLTMPAAGSEMSDSAVLTNEAVGKKAGVNTDFNRCRFAVMDPALGASLPKYQLAAGVTDILMHTLERYFIPNSHCELTDEIAEGLLRTVLRNGPRVVENPADYDAMCEIFWASSLSHNGITSCGREKDFSVHKLGHALSARYGVTHGASLAAVWGAWARTLYREYPARFANYAHKVWGLSAGEEDADARAGIEKTVSFFRSIGMPTSLTELGVNPTDQDLRALSLDATQGDTVKLSKLRPLAAKDVEEICRAAI